MIRLWNELTVPNFRKLMEEKPVAAVVVGSCEQHARHLPLGTDTILGEYMLKEAARKSKSTVLMLPTVSYGFSMHHMAYPGSVSLNQSTLVAAIEDIFLAVRKTGLKRLLALSSHGGNTASLQYAMNELGAKHGIKLIFTRYWDHAASYIQNEWRESEMGGLGHAGEMETALMMAVRPELVDRSQLDGYAIAPGNDWFGPDMFASNRIMMYNAFNEYAKDGNVGLPAYASAQKGQVLCEYVTDRLAEFIDGFWEDNPYI